MVLYILKDFIANMDVHFKYARALIDNGVRFDEDEEVNINKDSTVYTCVNATVSVNHLDCQSMKFDIPDSKLNLSDLKNLYNQIAKTYYV